MLEDKTPAESQKKPSSSLILLEEFKGDLDKDYEPNSVDLNQEYWSPQAEGETRRGVFWMIVPRTCTDTETGEMVELECAVLLFKQPDGKHGSFANGSKRLVGMIESNSIKQGTPLEITYKGKKKNKTNQNSSDHWSVVTLSKKEN